MSDKSAVRNQLLAYSILAFACFIFLGDSVGAFWRFDDGWHLHFALNTSPWQYFFVPEVTRAQSGAHITPWNALFYDVNLALFGVNPSYYYAHLLLVIYGASVMVFILVRQYAGSLAALFAALIFLSGPSTFRVSNELMTGHYVYGLFFSALSTLAFCRYNQKSSRASLFASVLLYALACACKEIYAPLPLLLFVVAKPPLQRKIWAIIPFSIVALLYLLWRYLVLRELVGGYEKTGASPIEGLVNVPLLLIGQNEWASFPVVFFLLAAVAGAVLLFLEGRSRAVIFFTGVFVALLPLYFLSGMSKLYEPSRYLYFPWFLFSLLFGFLLYKVPFGRFGKLTVGCILVVITVQSTAQDRKLFYEKAEYSERFYQAVANTRENEYIIPPVSPDLSQYVFFHYAHSEVTGREFNRKIFVTSSCSLKKILGKKATIFTFDGHENKFIEMPINKLRSMVFLHDEKRNECFENKPVETRLLSINLESSGNMVSWRFGPYKNGKYLLMFDSVPFCNKISSVGQYPMGAQEFQFRIMYESEEGWMAISPELIYRPLKNSPMTWSGMSVLPALDANSANCN